jgi:hypothetical protein
MKGCGEFGDNMTGKTDPWTSFEECFRKHGIVQGSEDCLEYLEDNALVIIEREAVK